MDAVLRKLELFGPIAPDDKAKLVKICSIAARDFAARTDVIQEGANPKYVHLVLDGFACRYHTLEDGSRQIVAFLLPGDFCDLHSYIMRKSDHNISTIARSKIIEIPRSDIEDILSTPTLSKKMYMSTLIDEATLRSWITNLGQRPAEQRMAHLFCELHVRLRNVGLARDGAFYLPLTQVDMAEAVGLSNVHVNRSLMALRARGLLSVDGKRMIIHDVDELEKMCGFAGDYLFLGGVSE